MFRPLRNTVLVLLGVFVPISLSCAAGAWEKEGDFYYLGKDSRTYFGAVAAGANKFPRKYARYDGIDFLVRGADDWKDYGRLNLEGNNYCSLPIKEGMKVQEVHLLAGGNYGNSYEHDSLLRLFKDNYYYGVITLLFVYQNGDFAQRCVPVFWDWFHLDGADWVREGARVRHVGRNPVRKDCSIYHISFANPLPAQALKNILVMDSWTSDRPFSDVFAVTVKSTEPMEALAKTDKVYSKPESTAENKPAEDKAKWDFSAGLDGWVSGCSQNWDLDGQWQADMYGKKGVVFLPGCNLGGDKFSWIENKISLPQWENITLKFSRHSAQLSETQKKWTDGLLKVMVRDLSGKVSLLYEKVYSGEWSGEEVDLTRFKGSAVIVRFENHGAGQVQLREGSSPLCDAEDALITDIRLENNISR